MRGVLARSGKQRKKFVGVRPHIAVDRGRLAQAEQRGCGQRPADGLPVRAGMFDHGDAAGLGIGLVAFILAGKDMNFRIEFFAAGAIAVGGDDVKQRFAAAGGRVTPGKTSRIDRDDRRRPRHPALDKGFMGGVLLAGPRVAELLEIVTASRIRSIYGIAEDEVLRGFRLWCDEGVNGLARAGVFDAAVEVGIMDRGSYGPVVHDRRSGRAGRGNRNDLPHSARQRPKSLRVGLSNRYAASRVARVERSVTRGRSRKLTYCSRIALRSIRATVSCYAARSATTASSTGKPSFVTRSLPSASTMMAPSSRSTAIRLGSSARPDSAA